MPNYLGCDPNALLVASKCFLEPCSSDAGREAIDILLRVRQLIALGGTDYSNPTVLQQAARGYNRMSPNERKSISLYLDLQNALTDGATFADGTDINGLNKGARCFMCIPRERRKDALLFLKCQLNSLDKPE